MTGKNIMKCFHFLTLMLPPLKLGVVYTKKSNTLDSLIELLRRVADPSLETKFVPKLLLLLILLLLLLVVVVLLDVDTVAFLKLS